MNRWPEITAVAALVATLAAAVMAHDPVAAAPESPSTALQSTSPDAGNSFAVRNVRVFDGERVIERANVVVRDGRIAAVGPDAAIEQGISIIEGRGKTLLPGFIDAHTHSWGSAQADALRFGVTAELDMLGDRSRLPAIARQRQSLERTAQADLWSAGAAVTVPDGHGTQYGMKVPTLAADGDVQAFVAARAQEGSDYIKLVVEDMSGYGGRRWPTLSASQVAAGIAAAHGAGKLALVHVSRQAEARHAVEAGADGLVHVFVDAPADDDFVRAAQQRGAFVVPTLSVLASVARVGEGAKLAVDPRLQALLSGEQLGSLKASFPASGNGEALDRALRSVRALHAAGVTILAGTDAGNPGTAHGASMHGELELLVRAGLTPTAALVAATSAPARRFGIHDRGRIAAGLRADLLLVDGDPTRDITATRVIAGVWKNGYAIERALTADAAPATATVLPAGNLISDFDGDAIAARVGHGWEPTTDQMMGGASTVSHALVTGGAAGSRGALEVTGEIKAGSSFPWAGVMYFPAAQPMQPVDVSARTELVFWARGDGRSYNAMLFSGASAQGLPSMQAFTAGPEWREVRLPLAGFAGADVALLRGIAFTARQPAGTFRFQLDRVELR